MLQPSGTLFLVVAATATAVCTVSATPATIGLLLLAATTTRAAWASAAMTAIRRATAIERTVTQSVVSKNQNNS